MSAPGPMAMPEDPFPDLTLLEIPAAKLNATPVFWQRLWDHRHGSRLALVEVLERTEAGDPARVRVIA